jgi:hypothetical protein
VSDLHDAVAAAVSQEMGGGEGGDGGQGESQPVETTVEPQVSEKQYLDLDEVGDRYVRIGEDEVPVKDLPSGYMKAKDYTQKTQELAQQRQLNAWAQTLQEALAQDFDGTVAVLRGAWQPETPQPQTQELDDPLAREVAELRSWRTAQEQTQVRSRIEHEVAELTQQYGEDFDFNEAAVLASERHVTLTDAQEILYGRKIRSGSSKAADLAAKTAAKRADSVVSAGGGSRAIEPGLVQFDDIHAALRASFKAAGALE